MFKKYLVLIILFIVPIIAYVFFASGVSSFANLPVLTQEVEELNGFEDSNGDAVYLTDKISVVLILGNEPVARQVAAYNLLHKIYRKNHKFYDFQLLALLPKSAASKLEPLYKEIEQSVEDMSDWKFAFAEEGHIEGFYASLNLPYELEEDGFSKYVFLIDKDRSLRGRTDDPDLGLLYGYEVENYAEINNKLGDDLKVLLAEYRLALKKNNHRNSILKNE